MQNVDMTTIIYITVNGGSRVFIKKLEYNITKKKN